MTISKFNVDNVVAWLSWAVSHFARSILLIITIYVNFAGTFNGQTKSSITWEMGAKQYINNKGLPALMLNASLLLIFKFTNVLQYPFGHLVIHPKHLHKSPPVWRLVTIFTRGLSKFASSDSPHAGEFPYSVANWNKASPESWNGPQRNWPLPAPLVSTMNSDTSNVRPSTSPFPETFTLEASPISEAPTMILKGLFVTWRLFFFTLTTCSPTSFGVNEIPVERKGNGDEVVQKLKEARNNNGQNIWSVTARNTKTQ